jgi:methylenetetrahydrofolate dehydrogenase (NADP+)/methenyltetrahydrofolate cyclohydrolase
MTISDPHHGDVIRPGADGGRIIDGKIAAAQVIAEVTERTRALAAKGVKPGLAVVLVGENPASQVYVKAKGKAAKEAGFHSVQHDLPATTSEADLLKLVDELNNDPAIHGILVQLPLPDGINSTKVLEAINPEKDADGFHPVNVGLLAIGSMERALVPCTPAGSLVLVEKAAEALGVKLDGMNAVIVGRSNIVGKPMVQLLLSKNMTVTVAHSRTKNLPDVVRAADLVVAAVGRPEMVKGDWIKPGAIVIDVGINRIEGEGLTAEGKKKTKLVGDVDYAGAAKNAAAITPVPGGVGPMTIAMLMSNTLRSAERAAG